MARADDIEKFLQDHSKDYVFCPQLQNARIKKVDCVRRHRTQKKVIRQGPKKVTINDRHTDRICRQCSRGEKLSIVQDRRQEKERQRERDKRDRINNRNRGNRKSGSKSSCRQRYRIIRWDVLLRRR